MWNGYGDIEKQMLWEEKDVYSGSKGAAELVINVTGNLLFRLCRI